MNPEGEESPSELKSSETSKGPDNIEQNSLESDSPVPKANAQAVPIKNEVEETILATNKKVVGENQIYSSMSEIKVEKMGFMEGLIDEETLAMNFNDLNPEGEGNPLRSAETCQEPDIAEQN